MLDAGRVLFDRHAVSELVGRRAGGCGWTDERARRARLAWRTGDGLIPARRRPPAGAELTAPTLEDAYLLLVGDKQLAVAS